MLNYSYPRITQIIPIDNMFQEHSGYEGKSVYIPIAALVLFEDILEGKIVQFSRYLSHYQLDSIEDNLHDARNTIDDDTWIANVHLDDITEECKANSNLA